MYSNLPVTHKHKPLTRGRIHLIPIISEKTTFHPENNSYVIIGKVLPMKRGTVSVLHVKELRSYIFEPPKALEFGCFHS